MNSNYEKDILKFWEKNNIFKKSLEKEAPNSEFVFYDGPPFATGTPHYGHLVCSIMKDVVPRYWTMKGYRVERKWGWDCHGLPIENIVEKEMKTKSKKDIEKIGVEKFNKTCGSKVLEYAADWEKTINRLGRWADMKNAYRTMDLDYMESVWWVFKQLWDKGLIYESYKSMHICPRCETTLSQSEVTEGYKDITDITATVKFELVDEPGTYVLAWTTTPWTLPGNVALAIGEDIEYVKVKIYKHNTEKGKDEASESYILAKDIYNEQEQLKSGAFLEAYFFGTSFEPNIGQKYRREFGGLEEIKGKDLVGKKYKPLFNYQLSITCPALKSLDPHGEEATRGINYQSPESLPSQQTIKNLYTIVSAHFVTTKEGTGIVHIAPAFGEDDMNLAKEKNLPFIQHVAMDGIFKDEVKDFKNLHVKPKGDPKATDKKIIEYLDSKKLLFSQSEVEHPYPHCWRCDTPLLNYATSSWFVNVTKIKPKALELAKQINWSPNHIKEGRFGKWLEGARDWSISRQRFWASAIPIWKCAGQKSDASCQKSDCLELKVIGSVAELEKLSGQKITDLHKHIIDKITFKCEKCNGTMKRIPDVFDCWFESGSMPYAQKHYPFENKKEFEANFPAEFIAEGSDQTRTWFYYLHIIATALFGKPAFKNVIVNGIVLAKDGKKMAKRLQNYPEPDTIMEQYGADALRFYLLSSPVMSAENFNFVENGVKEMYQKVILLLSNVLEFYKMYAGNNIAMKQYNNVTINILDRWILAKLNLLVQEVTSQMDAYNLVRSVRPIHEFINELSTWYIRRSRDRFKTVGTGQDQSGRSTAIATLGEVLLTLSKVMAPFTPFIAEKIYQELKCPTQPADPKMQESVHLAEWPKSNKKLIDEDLISQMDMVRQISSLGLEKRASEAIPVRQPLAKITVFGKTTDWLHAERGANVQAELEQLIKDELNILEIKWDKPKGNLAVEIDTKLTPALEAMGIARDLTRQINNLRKKKGLTIQDRISITFETKSQKIKSAIKTQKEKILADTLADKMEEGKVDSGEEVKIRKEAVKLEIR